MRYDFFFHLEDLLSSLARAWFERLHDLRAPDKARETNPLWFQSNQMLGGICYVDLFADNIESIKSNIPYFKELGLTCLHLMPLFKAPEGKTLAAVPSAVITKSIHRLARWSEGKQFHLCYNPWYDSSHWRNGLYRTRPRTSTF